jgi:photosystem II stability/assembly factor-like uncharacterized protein
MTTMDDVSAENTPAQDLVYGLAASPRFAQDGICFAARSSGLYRSDDGGANWHSAYDSLGLESPMATTAVVVSPGFESDRSLFAGAQGGVLRSVDGGENWNVALFPSPPPIVSTLVVSPNFTHDGTLFAGTMEDGVFRSADRGGRWSAWNFGLLDLNILCMAVSPAFATDETLFVGTESGVFRSTNGGRAWREVDFPTELAPVLSLALSPGYARDAVLFAGTESRGLFRSHDGGHTWEQLGEDVGSSDAVNGILLSPEFPAKPDILVALSTALLISRDGGQSWSGWKAGLALEQGVACVAAPQGLDPDALLLVGLVEGGVLQV